MKAYTRGGDTGSTSLFDGRRVAKDDPRVAAYGTVDEVNSLVSLARVAAPEKLKPVLERIQHELFTVGADLATPEDAKKATRRVTAAQVEALEKDTDALFAEVGNPGGFVLPGETEAGARLHVARAVARRAERLAVPLLAQGLNPEVLRYLNRLSSLLYAAAVWTDKVAAGRGLKNPRYG